MKKFIISIFLITLLFNNSAEARIDIIPQKIVIEGRDRNSELTVLNLLNTVGTFRIEVVNFQQNEHGIYTKIETPLDSNFDPSEIVRISPRQFKIEAGGRQKVRVSLRKPPNLPKGEYRFHIKATRLLQQEELKNEDVNSVNIIANIGVTIPAVIRHGEVSGNATLKNIKIVPPSNTKNNKPELQLNIHRTGDSSTLGAIEVFWEQNGQSEQIGRIKNMNIFTDINVRHVAVPLSKIPAGKGKIHVRYIDDVKKGHVFDEQWLPQE